MVRVYPTSVLPNQLVVLSELTVTAKGIGKLLGEEILTLEQYMIRKHLSGKMGLRSPQRKHSEEVQPRKIMKESQSHQHECQNNERVDSKEMEPMEI